MTEYPRAIVLPGQLTLFISFFTFFSFTFYFNTKTTVYWVSLINNVMIVSGEP